MKTGTRPDKTWKRGWKGRIGFCRKIVDALLEVLQPTTRKRVYLGLYNSPESITAFDKIMADWEAAHFERRPTVDVALTVSRLAVVFLKHADKEYRRGGVPTGETANFRHALQSMNNLFHGVRVIDFGPKKLKQLQQQMVKDGLAQQTINGPRWALATRSTD